MMITVSLIARASDVKIINLKSGQLEFWKPRREASLTFRPCFSIDPVVSMDKKIYKIHLIISLLANKKINPTNWSLRIHRLKPFNFKQYFYQDSQGNRAGADKIPNLQIAINENFIVGLEFEPETDYKPYLFENKVYKTVLACDTNEGSKRIKFKFRVRKRNLKAIKKVGKEAARDKQAKVVSFPIVM